MKHIKHNRGFTLIEMMTAVTIFAVVMTISMGSIISILNANKESEALKSVMDNLNLSVESMSREMRFGTNYHCGSSGNLTQVQNCSGGDTQVAFLASDQQTEIVYRLNGTTIEKSTTGGNGNSFLPVTAPEIKVDDLKFYVLGALPSAQETSDPFVGHPLQPKVLIKITGTAGSGNQTTSFTVETLVSQRILDNGL